MYDVVVVGGGPCGSAAAGYCAEAGLNVLCIEEHATIGHPVQCAGLLSKKAFDECRVSERSIQNRVQGARIFYGVDDFLTFDAGTTKAYVVDRGSLDREMAQNAAENGAEFSLKTYAYGFRDNTLLVRGVDGRREIPFRILIAADGPRSTIAHLHGMERPRVFLSGIQCEVKHNMDPSLVELHPHASRDFFGWAIPLGGGRVRIGLAGARDVWEQFLQFASRYDGGTLSLVTGTIPLGVMPRTYGQRMLYVGDAAGFPKPTSGGGIYTGVRSAYHAARTAIDCCALGNYGDHALRSYESAWKKDFGSELAMGFKFLSLRRKMSRAEVDHIMAQLNDPEMLEAIVRYGDMDRPSMLFKHLARKPGLIRIFGTLFMAGMRDVPD